MSLRSSSERRCLAPIEAPPVEACLARSWARGIRRTELEVHAGNVRAIGLYRVLGFEQEAVKRHAMRFDGAYCDGLLMSLLEGAV